MNRIALVALVIALTGCNDADSTFTLYRSSVVGPERIHVGSFDTKDGTEYNEANCRLAGDLFQQQPGVKVRFWCEKVDSSLRNKGCVLEQRCGNFYFVLN